MQQPKTINELMTNLVKRYNITPQVARPSANAISQLSRARDSVQAAIPHDSTLSEKINQLEKENTQQREQLRKQDIALEIKTKETKELKTLLSLKQKQFEQTLSEQMKRMRALEGHNQALQQELLSIKDLLREQQALIIQLNSSHDEE